MHGLQTRATIVHIARFAILAVVIAAGCASQKKPHRTSNTKPTTEPTTRLTAAADMSVDEIEPRPELRATTKPVSTTKPSLDSIALFAEARDAMLTGKRFTAITLLEKAIKLDPDSYELRYTLGQANTGPGMSYDPAIAAFEAAAAIEDDHASVHTELGRLYLSKGNVTKAIQHLRLATQTSGYDTDDAQAAIIDYFLAKSLQQGGYDRAALDSYRNLIERLHSGAVATRGSPELSYLVSRPEALFVQVGELCEKRGMYEDAIHLYNLAAERQPDDFSYKAHAVRALVKSGKTEAAAKDASELVQQFHASPDSLTLLTEVFRKQGGNEAVARELQRLRKESPTDSVILYALVDLLNDMKRGPEAQQLLVESLKQTRYPAEMVKRLFKMYDNAGDVDSAARLMIETLAVRPDGMRELLPMWVQLLRPWRKNHLTLTRLQTLEVSPQAQASKDFWISQLARIWGRDVLSRTALEDAVKQVPPFAPAYRGLLGRYWARDDWDAAQKQKQSTELIESVEKQGDTVLAEELRGLVLLSTNQPAEAAKRFAAAIENGTPSADLRLSYASALTAAGEGTRAQQNLLKLVADHPDCEDAYLQLFRIFIDAQQGEEALKVLNTWRANDPTSINAKILEATVRARANQQDDALRILDELFAREPDNAEVLSAMNEFYSASGRLDQFTGKLEAQRAAHPENRTVLEQLIQIHASRKEFDAAGRALDATRTAAAGDPDLLYMVANFYTRIGQRDMTEKVLADVLKVDPKHPAASNDLGYDWADQGQHLDRAEELVRIAVAAEPDNQSFLDSLGWVLYKRGKFAEARTALDEAIGTSSLPDPIVLDHLGDTLYRLNLKPEAMAQWKHSQKRLGDAGPEADTRDELRELRVQLEEKLKQLQAGEPVTVAPTASEPAKQAKN